VPERIQALRRDMKIVVLLRSFFFNRD
jgi:hypothetical protein